jgi:hypothetical protein
LRGLRQWVVGGQVHEKADAAHPLALLRARDHRPRRRTADQRDELAPSHHAALKPRITHYHTAHAMSGSQSPPWAAPTLRENP